MKPAFMRLLVAMCMLAGAVSVLGAQERTITVSVAARALARGDTLQASDIATMDTTVVWRWTTIAPDTTRALPGWVTR
jgi:flagella basal body P-ring formation protein FlgA